jgi:hypothetical protein
MGNAIRPRIDVELTADQGEHASVYPLRISVERV